MKRFFADLADLLLGVVNWITSRTWAMALALVLAFSAPELLWALYLLWRELN